MFVELALRHAIAAPKNAVATSPITVSAVLNLAENAQSYVVKWLHSRQKATGHYAMFFNRLSICKTSHSSLRRLFREKSSENAYSP